MNAPVVGRGEVYEDSSAVFLARISDATGATVSQATVASVSYEIWDRTAGGTAAISTATIAVSNVIYTQLQTNAVLWTVDDTGYNFAHTMGTAMSTANHTYMVQYNLTMTSGDAFPVQFEVVSRKVY